MLIKSRFLDACILGFIVLSTYNPTLGILSIAIALIAALDVTVLNRLQCANGIEALFDKSVHDITACIPAVTKEIRGHWRYGQPTGNLLHQESVKHHPGLRQL